MSLLHLPDKVLLLVARELESLDSEGTINAFAQTNRHLYLVLNPFLYRHNAMHHGDDHCSALFWAIEWGHEQTIRTSIRYGASVNKKQKEVWPSPNPKERGVRLVRRVRRWAYGSGSPLCLAVRERFRTAVEILIENGANVNEHIALDVLLRDSGDISGSMRNGCTLLELAKKDSSADIVQLLLENGAYRVRRTVSEY